MKKFILLLLVFVCANVIAQDICPTGAFSSISNSPTNAGFRTVSYGEDIFAFGAQSYRYSTVNDTWTSIPNMPTVRGDMGVAEVGGKIYCIGGYTGNWSNKNEAYNTATNTWEIKANLPIAISGCHAVSLNDKIYVFGGTSGNTSSFFYEYNPITNTYLSLALPTQQRMHAGLVTYNDRIFLIGGYFFNGTYNTINKLDEYNPTTNTWVSKANLPISNQAFNGTVLDDKLFVFGGTQTSPSWSPTSSFIIYDFLNNSWTTMPNMPFSRAYLDPKTVNGEIYLFGGHISSTTLTNQCHKYSCYTCTDVTVTDTQTILVSDPSFEALSPKTYYEGTDNLITSIGGCDSIVNRYTQYVFQPSVCTDTVLITVTDTLIINTNIISVNPLQYENTIKIYPNPANDYLTIDYGNVETMSGHYLTIENAAGQWVFQEVIVQPVTQIDLSQWTGPGLYFVHLWNSNGNIIDTRKIVIQ